MPWLVRFFFLLQLILMGRNILIHLHTALHHLYIWHVNWTNLCTVFYNKQIYIRQVSVLTWPAVKNMQQIDLNKKYLIGLSSTVIIDVKALVVTRWWTCNSSRAYLDRHYLDWFFFGLRGLDGSAPTECVYEQSCPSQLRRQSDALRRSVQYSTVLFGSFYCGQHFS